jgi:hypothetical protein
MIGFKIHPAIVLAVIVAIIVGAIWWRRRQP